MRSGSVAGECRTPTRSRWTRRIAVAAAGLLLVPAPVAILAQGQQTPPQGDEQKPAPKLNPDQIDALVAPIALYPDPLLSQALMASTYPLEIIQAQQWLAKNSKLKGDELEKAVKAQEWEPAVQATVMVPDLLKRLAEDITWTTNLGNTFLAQQQDVMDSVQRLRKKAKDSGKLESNEKMKVETKVVEQQTVVVIEPASPQVVYVPAYSPTVVWGPPVYPYPPVYYPPPPPPGAMLFTFSMGVMMGAAMHGGYCCGCGWGHNSTVVINNRNTFVNNYNTRNNVRTGGGSSNWQHSPQHRGGAPYGDRATATKYGGGSRGGGASTMDRGGYGGNRGGAGASTMDRGGAGGAGNRGGASASTADRGAGGYGGNRGGASASTMDRGGAGGGGFGGGAGPTTSDMSRGGGGGIGNQSVGPPAGGSAFGGAGGGANRATASSSRGASSMGGRGGGGYGGGGGRGGGGRGGGRR